MYATSLSNVMELVEEVVFRKLDSRLARLLVHREPVVNETHQKLADELGSVSRDRVGLEREKITVLCAKALAGFARG